MKNLFPILLPLLASGPRTGYSGDTRGADPPMRAVEGGRGTYCCMVMTKSCLYRSPGTRTPVSTATRQNARIHAMAESGKPASAGPFKEIGTFRGIFIPEVATRQETKTLVQANTASPAGRRETTILPTGLTGALGKTPAIHRSIIKQ